MSEMFIVERRPFLFWTQGELMSRDRSGRVVVSDDERHEEALRLLDGGKVVYLSCDGKVFSKIKKESDGYREMLLSMEEKEVIEKEGK